MQNDLNFEYWTRAQVNQDFNNLMNYLNNPIQRALNFDYLYLSNRGINHFKDVKFLFQLNYSLLAFTSGILFYLKWKSYILPKEVIGVTKFIKWSLISICLTALLFFQKSFVIFHRLFFSNNDWIFDEQTDPIINFLPQTFFLFCFLLILFISILTLTLVHRLFNKKEEVNSIEEV